LEIQRIVCHTSEETQQKIDWAKLWGEMYPVLLSDPQQVDVERYKEPLKALIRDLEREQGYSPQDAFLVLKDILGKLWTDGQPAASNP